MKLMVVILNSKLSYIIYLANTPYVVFSVSTGTDTKKPGYTPGYTASLGGMASLSSVLIKYLVYKCNAL